MQSVGFHTHIKSLVWRLRASNRISWILLSLAILLIVFLGLWLGTGRRYFNFDNPAHDIVTLQANEVDYHMLYPSIQSKATFADTFDWWHEAWRPDEWVGAYWRPLSMQVWWIEAKVFGIDRSHSWMRVSLILSAIFDVLLFLFFWKITKRRSVALIGLAIFALPGSWISAFNPLVAQPRIWNVDLLLCQGWKDQPDLFANCLTIGALLHAIDRRYAWALLCATLAPCFKESGLMVFPLLLTVILYQGDIKKVPKWIYVGVIAFLTLYMFGRWSSGPMVFRFHTHGGDAGAWARYSSAMLPVAVLSLASLGEAVAGAGLFSLALWRPKRVYVWLVFLVLLMAVSVAIVAVQSGQPLDVAFASFVLNVGSAALFALWLFVGLVVWVQREFVRPAVFFAGCAFFLAIPFAMVTGALEHVLTLARAFQAGYGACVAFALGSLLYERVTRAKPQSVRPSEEGKPLLIEA